MSTLDRTFDPGGTTATVDPVAVATLRFEQMERAWNQADGAAFGTVFADEMDFVDIRGTHHQGDGASIGRGHQEIFDSIYAGSTVRYDLDVARIVTPGCIVAVATSTLEAPIGPLQGVNNSRITAVIVERDGRWEVAAFHNTLVRPDA